MKKILYCLILLFGIFATLHAEDYSIKYDILLKEGTGLFKPIEHYSKLKKNETYEMQILCNIQRPWNVRAGTMRMPIWVNLASKNFDLSLRNEKRFDSYRRDYNYDFIERAEERYKALIEDESVDRETQSFVKIVSFVSLVRESGDVSTESFYLKFTPKSTGNFIFYLELPHRFISEDKEFYLELPVVN